MVHLGEPEYYAAVYADAFSHDVVLVEGVRSPITRRITRSYRWLAGSKTLGLVVQPRPPADCHARIVHADVSGQEFAELWKLVPIWLRVFVSIGAPVIGLKGRWFDTRRSLGKAIASMDDAPSQEELSFNPEFGGLHHAILDARDERLVARLMEQLDSPTSGETRLAVVYGAAHMRAVLRSLTGVRGFRPDGGAWLTVFSLA